MTGSFGFSVCCYRGDLPLARALLSSIRMFAPDAPICLVVDGDCPTRALEKTYGVHVIRREDVKNPDLRKWSFGFGLTKMVAFWEAPFDIVFHIDADAVLWGDIRRNLPPDPWDVVHNEPHEIITDYIQKTQYFDPKRIFDHIDYFPWEANPYFQAGVVCIRRGALDLDEYMRMLEGQRKHPDVFVNGDQGMLNILVFRAARAGKLVAKKSHLQTVLPVCQKSELEKQFQIIHGKPNVQGCPTILHWAGPKPWMQNKEVFREPMDFFRSRGLKECGLPYLFPVRAADLADEYLARNLPRQIQNLKNMIASNILGKKHN